MVESLKLTEEEQKLYNEKKKTIEDFNSYFTNKLNVSQYNSRRLITSTIYEGFSFKEVIQDDFLFNFYGELTSLTSDSPNRSLFNYSWMKEGYETLTDIEEVKTIIGLFIKFIERYKLKSGYYFDQIIQTISSINCNNLMTGQDIAEFLFKNEFFKGGWVSSSDINTFIDDLIISAKLTDTKEFIDMIKKQVPDYKGFPLIIMNQNIDQEEKIKALKLVYIQKDFPQYKRFFRRNLKNLMDLDSFIEAVVIQNNRVREKDINVIKIIKDIFISTEGVRSGDYCGRYTNEEEFGKKYREYFKKPDFGRKFYIETVGQFSTETWCREKQYRGFIKLIFQDVGDNELFECLEASPNLKFLAEERLPKQLLFAERDGNTEIAEKIIKIFVNWGVDNFSSFTELFSIERLKEIFNIYEPTGLLDPLFEKCKIFNIKTNGYNDGYIISSKDKVIESFFSNNDVLKKIVVFTAPEDVSVFGVPYEKCKYIYERQTTGIMQYVIPAMLQVYQKLNDLVVDQNISQEKLKERDEIIIDKFLKQFEDIENASIMSNNIIDFFSDSHFKYYDGWYQKAKVIDAFIKVLNYITNIAKNSYEFLGQSNPEYLTRYEKFNENIEETKSTIELLCNISI